MSKGITQPEEVPPGMEQHAENRIGHGLAFVAAAPLFLRPRVVNVTEDQDRLRSGHGSLECRNPAGRDTRLP